MLLWSGWASQSKEVGWIRPRLTCENQKGGRKEREETGTTMKDRLPPFGLSPPPGMRKSLVGSGTKVTDGTKDALRKIQNSSTSNIYFLESGDTFI